MSDALSSQKKAKNQFHDILQEAPHKDYIREYIYLFVLGIVFCLLIAVITYNPSDPTTFNINSDAQTGVYQTTNILGPLGASLADWAFQLTGVGSIVFLFIFVVQILNTYRCPRIKSRFFLRLIGYPQLILCYLGLASSIAPQLHFRGIDIYTGGLVGHALVKLVTNIVGNLGCFIVFLIGFVSSLTLCLGIRPMATMVWFLGKIPVRKIRNIGHELEYVQTEEITAPVKTEDQTPSFSFAKPNMQKTQIQNEIKNHTDFKEEPEKQSLYKTTDRFVSKENFNLLLELLITHVSPKKNREQEFVRLKNEAHQIEEKLFDFGIKGNVIHSKNGPIINVHEFEPAFGIKVNKIISLQDDLTLALKTQSILIELQPGKNSFGIEVPASIQEVVSLKDIIDSSQFKNQNIPLPIALGKNIDGSLLIADLASMPHLLIAGATGSGKSICINTMLLSLIMTKTPQQLRLLLIDSKRLELSNYDGIGHLLMPVITAADKAAVALKWTIQEMERRCLFMKNHQIRNITAFNTALERGEIAFKEDEKTNLEPLAYIVVVINELCDLMMLSPKDVEDSIQRLAQKSRAVGIHLIIATQRPSVDVLTNVIKANLPCRLSFQVASRHDSRTIIEGIGAERLLGKGDMLFLLPGVSRILRAQCAFVSDKEINDVVNRLKIMYPTFYEKNIMLEIEQDI